MEKHHRLGTGEGQRGLMNNRDLCLALLEAESPRSMHEQTQCESQLSGPQAKPSGLGGREKVSGPPG